MDITIEKLKADNIFSIDGFTVYIDDQRILTITTGCYTASTKWLREVQKSYRNKRRPLIVSVCVDREALNYKKGGLEDTPYDFMSLCIGSHCLHYEMPTSEYQLPIAFNQLLSDPRTIAVGMDIATVAEKLEKDYGLKMSNPRDLRSLAQKVLRRDDLDLGRYGLDHLAKVVLGKHRDVIRPSKKLRWRDKVRRGTYFYGYPLINSEKVKYGTVDAYLCFEMGSKLLMMIDSSSSSSSTSRK